MPPPFMAEINTKDEVYTFLAWRQTQGRVRLFYPQPVPSSAVVSSSSRESPVKMNCVLVQAKGPAYDTHLINHCLQTAAAIVWRPSCTSSEGVWLPMWGSVGSSYSVRIPRGKLLARILSEWPPWPQHVIGLCFSMDSQEGGLLDKNV